MAKKDAPKTAPKADTKDETKPLTEAEKAAQEKAVHEKNIRDTNNASMKAAKQTLLKFKDTKNFEKLPEEIKTALVRVIGKTPGGGGLNRDSFADTLLSIFPKVKTSIAELDIFKLTKMGRSEFRRRIRESLKKALPENRRWVEFDEKTESWTLYATGAEAPKEFKGKAIV